MYAILNKVNIYQCDKKTQDRFRSYLQGRTQCVQPLMPQSHCTEWGRIDHSSLYGWSFLVILAMTMTLTIDLNSVLLVHVASAGRYKSFEHVQNFCEPSANNFHSCLCALRICSYRVCHTAYVLYSSHSNYTTSFVHVTFQMNGVRVWLDREEENRVVFLLFLCYTRKLREWFVLLFALLVVPILAHTCWVRTFSCLSWERTVHYTIVLIPTVFLQYALVSNCYLVTIFFIRIIREKFEFTSYAHLWSFANIILLCRLGSIHVIFLCYYYQERTKLKWKFHDSSLPKQELALISNFYICPSSAVDSAQ